MPDFLVQILFRNNAHAGGGSQIESAHFAVIAHDRKLGDRGLLLILLFSGQLYLIDAQ